MSTLTVMVLSLLCIPLTSFLMLVDFFFLQYMSLSILTPLLCIPLTILLKIVDPPFLQCMSLPGLPLLVANSNLDPLQYFRLMWITYCGKFLMITALQLHSNFCHLFSTCFSLPSSSAASYFANLRLSLTIDLPLGLSFCFKLYYTFTDMLEFSVSNYFFCLGILLKLS